MRIYCPVAYGSPMSNSMKRKEMGSNAWQSSTWKLWGRERGKGTPLSSAVHQEVPSAAVPTQDGYTEKPFVEVVGGWGCARTSLPPASVPRRGVCAGEKVGWKVKSSFICTPSILLPPWIPLSPSLLSRTRSRGFYLYDPLLLGMLDEDVWKRSKGCRKGRLGRVRAHLPTPSGAAKMFRALFSGDAWLGTLVCICSSSEHSQLHPKSVRSRLWTNTEWCKTSENSASCDHK